MLDNTSKTFNLNGIKLKTLTEDDLETLRNWRNDPQISQFMNTNEHITKEMQIKWFSKVLASKDNQYFVIYQENTPAGVVNFINYDKETKSAEAAIYLDPKLQNSTLGIASNISFIEICFDKFGITTLNAEVLAHNKRALRFNLSLGYKITKTTEDKKFLALTKPSFLESTKKFKAFLNM